MFNNSFGLKKFENIFSLPPRPRPLAPQSDPRVCRPSANPGHRVPELRGRPPSLVPCPPPPPPPPAASAQNPPAPPPWELSEPAPRGEGRRGRCRSLPRRPARTEGRSVSSGSASPPAVYTAAALSTEQQRRRRRWAGRISSAGGLRRRARWRGGGPSPTKVDSS